MSNALARRISLPHLLGGIAIFCALLYISLIAIVMSYAAVTVAFTQSVRTDEAQVAQLETAYLAKVNAITNTDYASEGYAKPIAQIYVEGSPGTALNIR